MYLRRALSKNRFATLALATLLWAPSAWSDEEPSLLKDDLGIAGSVRGSYFSKDLSFNDQKDFGIGSAWLTAKPKEVWGIGTYFDGRVQGQNLSRNSDLKWEVREGYAQTSISDLDLRVGRQITVWGRADKVNPTDVWTTRDLTLLVPDDDDNKLGVSSAQSTWNLGNYHLIALWQPEWRKPIFPTPGLPPGITFTNLDPSNAAAQFGIKLDHSGEGTDWSVSYAHALDRTPDVTVLGPTSLGFNYQFIDVYGADAAIPIGNYGLRAEVAYTRTQDHNGQDPLTKNSNFFSVFGAERTFDGVFTVNAQYLYRHTFDFQDPNSITDPNVRLIASQVNLASNQLAEDMHGASVRLSHKAFNETLESEIAFVDWFKKGDSFIRPKVTYAFTDHWKGSVGGIIYSGPSDSFFGRLSDASTVFAEVRFNF